MLSQEQIQIAKRLKEDFPFRLKSTLKIKDKEGKLVPFELNDVQLYINKILDEQKAETGRVRAIILKGRKQGCSTLAAGRFFDRMMREDGIESFILAHRQDTVETLYDIAARFHETYPDYQVKDGDNYIICKQPIVQQNANRFTFKNGSGYTVGTAGKGEIGRGFTIQQLHLSEAAFYENGEKISSSIMEAVPDAEGTEIIVESTANGIGGLFHSLVMKARQGKGSYKLIFIPWFWQKEYRKKTPEDFKITEEERKYKETYNLDDEQIFWRRLKIEDSDDGVIQFRREYPATIEEAFDTSGADGYFDEQDIADAMNAELPPGKFRVVCGLDIAGDGNNADRTVFSLRRGRHQFKTLIYHKKKPEEIIMIAKEIIKHYKISKMFVDKGFNPMICDILVRDFPSIVVGVFFGGAPDNPTMFRNKRGEMIWRAKMWLRDKPVKVEPSEGLKKELLCIRKKEKLGEHEKTEFYSKKEIKETLGISPDEADAFLLTFAYLVEDYDDVDWLELEEDEQSSLHGCPITGY